ncbi:MAG: hypothetical protein OEZ13_04145 [Spirochaetia bacterium]|nr:hypothetical protein [Spirochaetia bacterium]
MRKRDKQKIIFYFLGLALFFLSLEGFFRIFPDIFSNLTERVKLKSAMYMRRKPTPILFYGSSRFKDGISPKVITKRLENTTTQQYESFNAAITGTDIYRLEWFVKRVVENKNLKIFILEISPPMFVEGDHGFENKNQDTESVEDFLSERLKENFSIVEWRKSLKINILIRSAALLGANYFEGSELFRRGAVSDFFKSDKIKMTENIKISWTPQIIKARTNNDAVVSKETKLYQDISKIMQKNRIKLFFVIPPLTIKKQNEECNKSEIEKYKNIANATGVNIFNFGCLDLEEKYFIDDSHLSHLGRHYFSEILAIKIAESIL